MNQYILHQAEKLTSECCRILKEDPTSASFKEALTFSSFSQEEGTCLFCILGRVGRGNFEENSTYLTSIFNSAGPAMAEALMKSYGKYDSLMIAISNDLGKIKIERSNINKIEACILSSLKDHLTTQFINDVCSTYSSLLLTSDNSLIRSVAESHVNYRG